MENQEIQQLKKEIARLEKVNQALMGRVERSMAGSQNAFSLFEGNILLANQVEQRTKELKEMTEVLDQEKEKVLKILKCLPGAILIFNDDYSIIDSHLNRVTPESVAQIFDSKENAFCEQFVMSLKHSVVRIKNSERAVFFSYLKSSSDSEYFLDCAITRITDSTLMLFVTDSTEKYKQEKIIKEQEVHLLQAAKLSSLGEMAGGVAHEINTPLGTIMMLASRMKSLAKKEKLDIEKTLNVSEQIKKTVAQISKIVQSLRQLSRDGEGDELEVTNPREVLNDALELCQQKFKMNSVDLKIDSSSDLKILARRVQLSQVFLNLLNNSLQAVTGTENPWVKIQFVDQGSSARIYIIDSGKGIENEVVEKIFDPFFTTKKVGEGTGLGMSISKRIVESHQGKLGYELKNGHTSFYIELQKETETSIEAS